MPCEALGAVAGVRVSAYLRVAGHGARDSAWHDVGGDVKSARERREYT